MRNRFSPGIEKAAKTPARLGNPYSSPCGSAQSTSASVSEGRRWRRLQAIERPTPRRIPAVRITRDMPGHGHTGLLETSLSGSRPSPRSPQTRWCPLSMIARLPTQYAVQGVRLSPGGGSSQPLNDHWRTSRRAIDDSESQSRRVVCGGCVRVA